MMGNMSVHVVDVTSGIVAQGLAIRVVRVEGLDRQSLYLGKIEENGLASGLSELFIRKSICEVIFEVGCYYRNERCELPEMPFLDEVVYRFGLDDPQQHYHCPFKMTPWGFSCFRGGA
ncbi:hypothetical protein Brsp01_44500 [Brucella sp. NBRC 12950]|nr:hypothetical protein Brsp01_44500 [Brucella sp. NBRC 12950]